MVEHRDHENSAWLRAVNKRIGKATQKAATTFALKDSVRQWRPKYGLNCCLKCSCKLEPQAR